MEFEQYLLSKKIDPAGFRHGEEKLWSLWEQEFAQLHPKSFTARKLYEINQVRRQYTLLQGDENRQK